MLFNNVKPLTKRNHELPGDTKESAILRALSGSYCSVCDSPLPTKDCPRIHQQPEPYTAYTCCGVAHCPYCSASAKERCSHLFASRSYGDWRIQGLPDVSNLSLPEPPPVFAESLLDYSEAQKQTAWGEAYPLFAKLYGPGWLRLESDRISGGDLVRDVARPMNRQDVGSANMFFFDTDGNDAAVRIRKALTKDIGAGFERMQRELPTGSEFVLRVLSLPEDESTLPMNREITAVALSPRSDRYAILGWASGKIGTVEPTGTSEPVHFTKGNTPKRGYLKYCSVQFSPDGCHVATRCSDTGTYSVLEDGFTEIRSVENGFLLHKIPEGGDTSFETGRDMDSAAPPLDGFLHGGATYLTVRNRCIRLYTLSSGDSYGEPSLMMTLRLPVSYLAIAPDGETFITTAGPYAVLWRVPRRAMSSS